MATIPDFSDGFAWPAERRGAPNGARAARAVAGRRRRASRYRRCTPPPTSPASTSWAPTRASSRTCAARTRRCTSTSRGRSASTPGSPPPPSPTRSTGATWPMGQKGLSIAFDLPTHRGYDSDNPRVVGDVGMAGVADRLDLRHARAVRRHPARRDERVDDDERRGAARARALRRRGRGAGRRAGAARRDHPERHPQGVHGPQHLHLSAAAVDADHQRHLRVHVAARCRSSTRSRSPATTSRRPERRPTSSSRTRSPTASSTSAPGSTPGWTIDKFAPRLSFFWAIGMNFFMEVAKLRAARLLWAKLVQAVRADERQVAVAAHPLADLGLVADRAGRVQQRRSAPASRRWPPRRGTPSRCTPTRWTRRSRCPRTSRPASPATPSWCCSRSPAPRGSSTRGAASYYVEKLTYDLARRAWAHISEVEEAGGMAKAIDDGLPKLRIEEAAARTQARIDSGRQPVIGVNKYRLPSEDLLDVLKVDNSAVRARAGREAAPAARGARRVGDSAAARRADPRPPTPSSRAWSTTCSPWPSTPRGRRRPSARSPTRWRRSTGGTRRRSGRSPASTGRSRARWI